MIGRATVDSTDRSKTARQISRTINRKGWIDSVVYQAQQLSRSLHGATSDQLRRHTDRLRRAAHQPDNDWETQLVLATAAVIESVRQALGWELFHPQLHAGIVVATGGVAEMQTGEGKSLAVVLPAYLHSLAGRGVHVATPNEYLAKRDCHRLAPVYDRLGICTGLLQDQMHDDEKRKAYNADITYGPGHTYGFDYLRDQLLLSQTESTTLGQQTAARLRESSMQPKLIQNDLYATIIDEIDHVLIDDAVSPLILTTADDSESPDAEIHHAALGVIESMTQGIEFAIDPSGQIELSRTGFDRLYDDQPMAIHPKLNRSWHEYVMIGLRAKHLLKRDVHYVIREKTIQIVDVSTGRIYADRTWSRGLHQAIAAKEGLPIPSETTPQAIITRQRFYRHYPMIAGMTGTATGCETEFASVYGMPVIPVPLRVASKRVHLRPCIAATWSEKLSQIVAEAKSVHATGRAILIGTKNITQSREIAERLQSCGLSFRLLNGDQDQDEAEIIARAGQHAAITIATNLAGRGTDIRLDPIVSQLGGLHVIAVEHQALDRVDRQLMGRCARCGDPGSVRFFLSAQDTLFQTHAPWIGRAIIRWDKQGRPGSLALDRHVAGIQKSQQRIQTTERMRLLRSDQRSEALLVRNSATPRGCLQLSVQGVKQTC